jgi:kynurenine 3-monooxygenase
VWFKSQFADAVPFIGEEAIVDAFRRNPRSPLIAIKVSAYSIIVDRLVELN